MDMDNIFIAKVAIQKQSMNERHCYDITPILGRSTLDLKAYCPKINLMALTKVEFQSSV